MTTRKSIFSLAMLLSAMVFVACDDNDGDNKPTPKDPDTAMQVSVDRFTEDAGTLMVRTSSNGLPAANEAIDFDAGEPFITSGLGPDGEMVMYYNFDVQPTEPAPIYALFRADGNAVESQLNIIDVIPGDDGYNDFWQVHKVTVPDDYVANTVTSFAEIESMGYAIEETAILVNCPVVPAGSSATKRMGDGASSLFRGWYQGEVVFYFTFSEKSLAVSDDEVPLSPIYVAFNINPDAGNPASGPASGFVTEESTVQTHNVVATIPSDSDYSPLWWVNVYNNEDFDDVDDLMSALDADILAEGVASVNCPIVSVAP